jgi:hypothetical protein
MCVRAQTPALGIAIRSGQVKREENKARESKVEITNKLNAENDQHPQLSLVDFQAPDGSLRQPTAAELSILTFQKLRYARSRAQEMSNEFARLLNRGSSLE